MLSLGSGHTELIVAISQWKELRSVTKALVIAQENTANDMLKWSSKEENRAIRDVVDRFADICTLWTEAVKSFTHDLKEVRSHFEMILEGEKSVDSAKAQVKAAEAKEIKLRKEQKKLKDKSSSDLKEVADIQAKIVKTQNDLDYAESKATAAVKDNELVKMVRVKEAIGKICRSHVELAEKSQILFEAGSDIVSQIPELSPESLDDDVLNLKYPGAVKTTQIVIKAKDTLDRRRDRRSLSTVDIPSSVGSTSANTTFDSPLPSSPPAYSEINRQLPVNPYYPPSPVDGQMNETGSPAHIYPRLNDSRY